MKKVLFVINNMEIGGTRTSLLNLLNELTKRDDIIVDLFLLAHHGVLYERIPEKINILPGIFTVENALPQKEKRSIFANAYHVAFHVAKRLIGYRCIFSPVFQKAAKHIEEMRGEYDAVIGYQEGISNYFSSFVKARHHLTWIHNDIEHWYDESTFSFSTYNLADEILFVADIACEKFSNRYPQLKYKCRVVKNTINSELLLSKCNDVSKNYKPEQGVLFVSVGRVTEQKAFDRIIPIVEKLNHQNYAVKWIIIGDGPLFEDLKSKLQFSGLRNIELLGSMENPYKVMRQADMIVVTSIYESQPMVILESLTLGIPVITTRYSSAEEVLLNKPYGIITDNNEEGLYTAILGVLSNPNLIETMKESTSSYKYDNDAIVDELIGLC